MLSVAVGLFTAENAALKTDQITADWMIMFAGDDITSVLRVIRRSRSKLGALGHQLSDVVPCDVVARATVDAFQEGRRQRASDQWLSPFGITLDRFLIGGQELLGDSETAVLRERIEMSELGCELLVFGFDSAVGDGKGFAKLFTVSDPGVFRDYHMPGYWAI